MTDIRHMGHLKFAEDESTVTVGASRYRAKEPATPAGCEGCAFKVGLGCSLAQASIDINDNNRTACVALERNDGKGIIWLKDVPSNFPELFPGSRWAQPKRRQIEL